MFHRAIVNRSILALILEQIVTVSAAFIKINCWRPIVLIPSLPDVLNQEVVPKYRLSAYHYVCTKKPLSHFIETPQHHHHLQGPASAHDGKPYIPYSENRYKRSHTVVVTHIQIALSPH